MAFVPEQRKMPGDFGNTNNPYAEETATQAESPSQLQQGDEDSFFKSGTDTSGQSSPYYLLLSGQIGNNPDLTVRRSSGTRISQNIGLASAALRRNPNRLENTEIAATLAHKWPLIDISPEIAFEVVKAASTSTPPRKPGTPKPVTPKPATPKQTTPNPATPKPSRDVEHKTYLDKLAYMDASKKYWSKTGEKYDVKYSNLIPAVRKQLNTSTPLGAGGSGTVQSIVCSGIPIARKSIRAPSASLLKAIKTEVHHVQSLAGHRHIVQLVGTYLSNDHGQDMFHILTFPVADCDMDAFLHSYEASLYPNCDAAITDRLFMASGLQPSASRYTPLSAQLSSFLKQALGCITSGLKWMHEAQISHDDIKPANILLRHGQTYITDFGISRDRRFAEDTSTEFFPGRTHGWSAPEKGDRHNPFKADIYSLGCIFMHVISLLSGKKKTKDCADILESPPVYRERYIEEHFAALGTAALASGTTAERYQRLLAMTVEMLRNDRRLRPVIDDVNERLLAIGDRGESFHGICCRPSEKDSPNRPASPEQ